MSEKGIKEGETERENRGWRKEKRGKETTQEEREEKERKLERVEGDEEEGGGREGRMTNSEGM